MQTMAAPLLFHLAFPVNNMEATKDFYVNRLGCSLGRHSARSMILNFYGSQIVAQKVSDKPDQPKSIYPRHFGLIFLDYTQWEMFVERCRRKKVEFFQEPRLRHRGESTEHHTCFIIDPSRNIIELKHYRQTQAIFECIDHSSIGDDQDPN